MQFSLLKAIKSTHRNPVNMILHLIGLPIYATGITLVAAYFLESTHKSHRWNNSMVNSDFFVLDGS